MEFEGRNPIRCECAPTPEQAPLEILNYQESDPFGASMLRSTSSISWGICGGVLGVGFFVCVFLSTALHAQGSSPPHIDSVRPNPVTGSIDLKHLTIRGRGFEEGFAVRLHSDGVVDTIIEAPKRLTYVDEKTVKVRAVFGNTASEWTAQVINPDSVASNAYMFRVEPPVPQIDVLRPLQRKDDGEAFEVVVRSSTLAPSSIVQWNGEDLPTTPIKSSPKSNAVIVGLKATVSPSAVKNPGRKALTVHTPPPGGGTSSPEFLTVAPQPFYQSVWFYLGGLGVLILVGVGGHWLRVRHIREQELEQKVRRRTEALREEKEKTEEQAERLQTLYEARRRLLRHVSHELRTPLTMISTPLRTVLDDMDATLPEDERELLDAALRNSKRLEDLVDQIEDLSQLESGHLSLEPRSGDLVAFVHEVTRSFELMAEQSGIELGVRAASDQLSWTFDAEKLRTVLENLIENALTFTPEGGTVLVRVHRAGDEAAVLRVSDTGPGIPEDDIRRLFERFYQGDGARRCSDGAGLGLALAKQLTELHGGTIQLESEFGFSTTFTVRLPRELEEKRATDSVGDRDGGAGRRATEGLPVDGSGVERRATEGLPVDRSGEEHRGTERAAEAPADEESASSESSPTVLIVEHDADVRTYLSNQLSDTYRIQEAEEGAEALDLARAESPDLILSDVMMPGMGGIELCRRVKNDDALHDVPVILLTAKAGEDPEVKGFDAGADAYVEKPFLMDPLRARIHTLIENRRSLREQYRDEVNMQPSGVSVTPEEKEFYEEARAVVEENIDDSGFTVEQFAGEMSVSRSTLRRRLKGATGQPPAEFVRHLRLERAAQLLREDAEMRVYEVADAVGYESPDHFSRLFREHFGVAPSEHSGQG